MTTSESILLCLSTQKGLEVLRALHARFPDVAFRISIGAESKVVESHKDRLAELAGEWAYPVHPWKEIRDGGTSWIAAHRVAAVICVGWTHLVPAAIRDAVRGRVVVAHDSLLPRYRGFAPLPTAMIQGDAEVGVTVLFAAEEVDAGDVLFQAGLHVKATDTIADLIAGVIPLYVDGVSHAVRGILRDELVGTPQDHAKATYGIWRDEQDLLVDWSDTADRIARTVRALGPPYLGARTRLGDRVVVIRDAAEVNDVRFEIRQPGKVWALTPRGEPIVVCGRGLLVIRDAEVDGAPLVPLARLRLRFG